MPAKMKLAEALLRRKELREKLQRMDAVRTKDMFEPRVRRIKVSDAIDEVVADVPKMTWAEFNQEYDHYARQLRIIDAVIQNVNWTTDVEPPQDVMQDFNPPEKN